MRIRELIWPEDRVDHIARHGVQPEEVDEVCFGDALVQQAKSHGKNPVFHVLGETSAGRNLLCVVIQFPDGNGYPVTARPATRDPQGEGALSEMGKTMTKAKLPNTDSIDELAKFWDTHDLTDFEEELEEVAGPVFAREKKSAVSVKLDPAQAKHIAGLQAASSRVQPAKRKSRGRV